MCPRLVMENCSFFLAALVVRFLTRRFIGDYERNAGKYPNNLIKYDELK